MGRRQQGFSNFGFMGGWGVEGLADGEGLEVDGLGDGEGRGTSSSSIISMGALMLGSSSK